MTKHIKLNSFSLKYIYSTQLTLTQYRFLIAEISWRYRKQASLRCQHTSTLLLVAASQQTVISLLRLVCFIWILQSACVGMSMVSCSLPRARQHIGKDNLRSELVILNAEVTELRTCEGNLQAEAFEYLASEMDKICARSICTLIRATRFLHVRLRTPTAGLLHTVPNMKNSS